MSLLPTVTCRVDGLPCHDVMCNGTTYCAARNWGSEATPAWANEWARLIVKAIVATQFPDEHRKGRMTCDTAELLKYINENKPK